MCWWEASTQCGRPRYQPRVLCAMQEQPDWSWDKCFVELRARVTDAIKVGGPLWEPRTACGSRRATA